MWLFVCSLQGIGFNKSLKYVILVLERIISKSANSIRTLERVRTKCLILTIAMHGIGLQVSTLLNHKNTALTQRIL